MHPLAERRPGIGAPDAPSATAAASFTQRNILMVERVAGVSQPWAAMLRATGHHVEVGMCKEQAFNRLFEAGDTVDVVLLDASLTQPNVITLAREFRRLLIAHCIPVIRLAAERDDAHTAAGIRAGISHYVEVPCTQDLVLALIDAVARRRAEQLRLRAASEKSSQALGGLAEATFRFRTLEDVERIAQLVASVCPASDRVILGLTELMLNAVEHGNLGIGREAKLRMNAQGVWFDEIRRKLAAPEQADRFATLRFKRDATGEQACGKATRLQDDDLAVAEQAAIEQDLRHLRRFSRTSRCLKNES